MSMFMNEYSNRLIIGSSAFQQLQDKLKQEFKQAEDPIWAFKFIKQLVDDAIRDNKEGE